MENVKLSPAQKFWKTVKSNPIVVLLVVIGIIVGFTKDNFFSWRNFGNLASNTAVRFLIALGVSGCLITKGTDLSAGRVFLKEADHAVRVVVVRMTEHRAVDIPDGKTERAHVFGKQAGRARVNQNAAAPMRCENRKSPFAMKRLLRNIIYNDGQFRLHGVSPFFVFLHCKRKAAASSSVCSDDSPAAEGSPGRMENSGL